jgi:hypothetical protein
MSTFGKELIESAKEALAIARGEIAPAWVILSRHVDKEKARPAG